MTTQPSALAPLPTSPADVMAFINALIPDSESKPRIAQVPPDPGLPTDLLPPTIETWLHDTALLAGVPPVMTTLPFLASTGGVIGNRLGLQLHPGWTEYPSLWIALVAFTGTGKTPALIATRRPFDLLHEELRAANLNGSSDATSPLIVDQVAWPRLEQALGQANGLILHRDELVGLINGINGRHGEDRQHYLSLWSADPIVRQREATILHPVVSIIGGIQPLLIERIRNRQPDGLMERFLIVVAGSRTTTWNYNLPATVPDIEPIMSVLRTLRGLASGHVIAFEPSANDLWGTWYNAHVNLYKPDPALLVPLGFYRKYPTHLARLALVMQALWHPQEPAAPLSATTLDRAITLMEYLRIQHHRSLSFINQRHVVMNPGDVLVGRVLDMLARAPTGGWVSRARLGSQLKDPPSTLVSSALATLLESGLIEHRTVKTAGRPVTEYRLPPVPTG